MVLILQSIFPIYLIFHENCSILIQISLKCASKGPINNNPGLVQIRTWCISYWRTYASLDLNESKPTLLFLVRIITVLGWGLLSQFPPFRYFPNFSVSSNTRYLLNIAFIFDRCRRSWAAVAPVKYKCDSNNLRGTFARTKILPTEKLRNGALVTPTPDDDTGAKPIWSFVIIWFTIFNEEPVAHRAW